MRCNMDGFVDPGGEQNRRSSLKNEPVGLKRTNPLHQKERLKIALFSFFAAVTND